MAGQGGVGGEGASRAAGKPFVHRVCVRPDEVDSMGVVHHSRYAVYLEEARTELLRAQGLTYRDMEKAGIFLVVAELSIKFRRPARLGDTLLIECGVTRATYVTVAHSYTARMAGSGEVALEAASRLACVGRDSRPTRLPDELLSILNVE